MKPTEALKYFLVFAVLYFAVQAMAMPEADVAPNVARRDVTSAGNADSASTAAHTEIYKIDDGYGSYVGQGKTKIQAASGAREACIMAKVNQYEYRHGVTPDADTADLFIDSCINK
jgi:hypothetical protein